MDGRPAPGSPAAHRGGAARALPSTSDEIGPAYAALMREQARRALVMQSIRASLQEQPSLRAVLACARRWVADVLRTAVDVAKSKRETRK
ncbi:hypothetical protein ACPCSD_10055 [Streptomyces griseoincarnatus]